MQTKLQELTDKIYNEGVQKAHEEADSILKKARQEADSILANAKKESEKTIQNATKKAEELHRNMEAEMKLAASQAISALKQQIAGLVTLKVVEPGVKEVFSDQDYLQKLIESVVKGWTQTGNFDLNVVLPEAKQAELSAFFKNNLAAELNNGLTFGFEKNLKAGFKVGPKDGSYIISLSEEDFKNFFKAYLRPKTNELLFEK
ncbi:V-type ATP synthase subunit E [Marinilabiliaceae bacterium JC017]|nr:V-type ATP synthase subunit E [Marinilabiliaceae bacterium JC017]